MAEMRETREPWIWKRTPVKLECPVVELLVGILTHSNLYTYREIQFQMTVYSSSQDPSHKNTYTPWCVSIQLYSEELYAMP